MLEKLFKFPIVMVDGMNEEKKNERAKLMNKEDDEELDIIMGEAEIPYYDFVSVTDRWLPTDESLTNALNGKFDACSVQFSNSGDYIVPWNKSKFKKELQKFINSLPEEPAAVQMTIEQLAEIVKAKHRRNEEV